MSKKVTTICFSDATLEQLEALSKYGNVTNIVALAVDRLYQQEVNT